MCTIIYIFIFSLLAHPAAYLQKARLFYVHIVESSELDGYLIFLSNAHITIYYYLVIQL